jgi:hypothetical protein
MGVDCNRVHLVFVFVLVFVLVLVLVLVLVRTRTKTKTKDEDQDKRRGRSHPLVEFPIRNSLTTGNTTSGAFLPRSTSAWP